MSESATKPPPVTVFYSYAHEDEPLLDDLRDHLRILERRGLLATWHDRRIAAGDDWDGEIDEHLRRAELVLLLLSKDFFGSDYIFGTELAVAMQRHARQEATVVPIVVRAVDLDPEDADELPFLKLQGLPTDLRPVTSWPNRDEAWTNVARGLRGVVKAIVERRPHRPAPEEGDADARAPRAAAAGSVSAGDAVRRAGRDGTAARGEGRRRLADDAAWTEPSPAAYGAARAGSMSPRRDVDRATPDSGTGTFGDRASRRRPGGDPPADAADADSGSEAAGRHGAAGPASPPPSAPARVPASDDPALERVVERFTESMSRASQQRGADSDTAALRQGAYGLIDRDDVPRLLWVDDNPGGNVKEREALARVQVEVITARSTADARALLEGEGAEAFDLVVSDWERPADGLGAGLALQDWLREHRPALPLVYYHGEFDPARRARRAEQARSHGAFGEAVLPEELLALVTRALGG